MHGRLKVKTSAERAEAKHQEREKKLKLYKNAMRLTFHKREVGELDVDTLHVTGDILAANPDVYTLWNIRREIYNLLMDKRSSEDLQTLFVDELHFIETCLKVNPKSYGCWQQRIWVLDNMPTPDWNNELFLCNKFLEYDERNFHCWDYRRVVAQKARISPEQELEFSTKKIATNFSNYSSWHYRSKLLLRLHGQNEAAGCHGDVRGQSEQRVLKEDALLKEFNIVQNAFFTDPDDQSAWFYQRWLLGKGETRLEIRRAGYNPATNTLIVTYTKPLAINDKRLYIRVSLNGDEIDGDWATPPTASPSSTQFSPVWIFTHDAVTTVTSVTVRLESDGVEVSQCEIRVAGVEDGFMLGGDALGDREFRMGVTAATNAILQSELESCLQLHDLEPLNKWALLTVVLLMRTLDYPQYEPHIDSHLKRLELLDPQRRAYYRDLGTRFITESALSSVQDLSVLNLAGRNLTALYHPSHMTFYREIDLSNNQLMSTSNFAAFQLVEKLNLNDNQVSSLDGLCLPRLKVLTLRNNHILTVGQLASLKQCPRLKIIELAGNPVCDTECDYVPRLQALLPTGCIVDGANS